MNRQVFTISPSGAVAGLQVKPGKGFDLRQMGHAKITRASEVLFAEDRQLWYVEVREGKFAGRIIDTALMALAGLSDVGHLNVLILPPEIGEPPARCYCAEYDQAVTLEIAVLDGLRERGLL